jgi:hypothetical protein
MPRAGSSSSLRIVTATPVSADSLSHCRPITAGSEPSSSAADVGSAAIARASARFSGCSAANQLDVPLGCRGVLIQFRFDGLCQRDDAGESLCERVMDPMRPAARTPDG